MVGRDRSCPQLPVRGLLQGFEVRVCLLRGSEHAQFLQILGDSM